MCVLLIRVLVEIRHFLSSIAFRSSLALNNGVPGLYARGGEGRVEEIMRYDGCDTTSKNKLH
jgi:hypothetical protein